MANYGRVLTCLNPCDPQIVAQLLKDCVGRDACIADIGCGRGTTLAWLSEHTDYMLFGTEPDRRLHDEALINCPKVAIAHSRAEDLPFGDWVFDAAIMECVFSIVDDPAAAICELNRIIRKNGVFLLTDLFTRGESDVSVGESPLLRFLYTKNTINSLFMYGGFSLCGFYDRTLDMGSMIAQMFMDGVARDYIGDDTRKLLKRSSAGYGIWVFAKI